VSNKSLIAGLIALAMGVWLFSGGLVSSMVTAAESDMPVPAGMALVRGIESVASERQQLLAVRGQTRANRVVQVKSEVSGRIEALPAVKGTQVRQGDLLCQIAVDSRASELDEARAQFKSAQFEFDGIVDLKQRKLQSEINVAKAKAALESSKAKLVKTELALAKTRILAPFDGVVESQPVETGDFLNIGQVCVGLMELDPMLVTGQVSEKNIGQVAIGDKVQVALITGEHFTGVLSFISRAPDAATRTYPIEVTISAPGDKMRAGMTADLSVPVGIERAHLISPASLVLSDAGNVGVRIVDDSNIVRFMEVSIISEEVDGIWVKGLPASIRLITVGQEEVFDGQPVRIDLTPLSSVAKF
jgi:membrane fusion protein, multidrug efflux system